MFYVEVEVKDMKLAEPLGLSMCTTETCPELVELRFSHRSLEAIRSNLRSFRRVFLGADPGMEGLGCDDLLRDVGAADRRAVGIEG